MKKTVAKFLSAFLVLAFVFSALSVTAFAATSQTFFTRSLCGYSCTGSGTVSDYSGRTVFNATANLLEPIIPSDACECVVWVYAYNKDGDLLRAALNNEGTISAVAQCTTTAKIYELECTYTFNNMDLGLYELYNP